MVDEIIPQILSDLYEEIYDNISNKVNDTSEQTQSEPELTTKSIDPITGEWILNEWDIECISIGAGILGCGGGGSPYIGRLRAKNAIKNGKKIRVIDANKYVQIILIQIVISRKIISWLLFLKYSKRVYFTFLIIESYFTLTG